MPTPHRTRLNRSLSAIVLGALLFTTAACSVPPTSATLPEPPTSAAAPAAVAGTTLAADSALATLATLPVKGRAPKTGYDRAEFGAAWADVDHNGCDTRNDILARDLTAVTFKDGTKECVIASGVLADPYTDTTISFLRGTDTSAAVQIDHVVALSDAWQKGAQQLSVEQRTALSNDPLNLLAVDGPANQQKSDGDAATWLPPSAAYRCAYVSRQIAVKATYSLWVTQGEHDAMATVLAGCTDQALPAASAPEAPAPVVEAPAPVVEAPAPAPAPVVEAPAPAPAPAPVVEAPAPAPAPVVYANCSAVRAAGAAPISVGQPGFSTKFDGDGDGVGCE